MKRVMVLTVLALFLASPALAVFRSTGEMCITDEEAREAKKFYDQALASEKAGKTKEAYTAGMSVNSACITDDESEWGILVGLFKRTSLKLGEGEEAGGRFSEAYEYYYRWHGIPADRVQMKMATADPGNFKAVQAGFNYFRSMKEGLENDTAAAGKPDREARLKAIAGYRTRLHEIAVTNGDKALAAEEKVFAARKKTLTAKDDSLDELENAERWLGLIGQDKRAHDRAVARGDALSAADGRNSLELAISYYDFARNEKKVQVVRGKARKLGDAHLQKGEKMIASEYYAIAGLEDRSTELRESDEAEKAKAESERKDQFKKDQDSLEKELGF